MQQQLDNRDNGLYRHDPNAHIAGLELDAPAKLTVALKAFPTRLTSAATPAAVTDSGALSHQILYDHWLGDSRVAAGSTVAVTPLPSVSGCTVATGHGSRFAVGQVVIINGEPRVIQSISTDAITWAPDLSAAPSSGDAVLNTWCFYRAEAQTQSLTIETAYLETGTPESQKRARGVVGQCAWSAEMGQIGTVAFDGKASSTDGPGDLSLSVSDVADDMGSIIRWDGVAYLQAAATTTAPTHVCVRSIKPDVKNKWTWVRCGSDENTINSAVATGGREDPIMFELTLRYDASMFTAFEAGTVYRLLAYTVQGSGSSQRFLGWHAPALVIDETPTENVVEGLVYLTVKMRALQSTTTSGSDLARSPAVLFAG